VFAGEKVLVKRGKKKIPRNAVEELVQTCEWISKLKKKESASEIFKRFLGLMNKYADYFFSMPWPQKYDFKEATTFTDEDVDFLFEREEDFADRHMTVCLKKNMYLEGFMGYFGILWTQQAFRERFIRPTYKPVLEAFEGFAQGAEDAQSVVNKLKEKFSVGLIHDSLIDLLEHEYPDKPKRRLIDGMLGLLHTVEGVPSCEQERCSWYWNQECGTSSASDKSFKEDTS